MLLELVLLMLYSVRFGREGMNGLKPIPSFRSLPTRPRIVLYGTRARKRLVDKEAFIHTHIPQADLGAAGCLCLSGHKLRRTFTAYQSVTSESCQAKPFWGALYLFCDWYAPSRKELIYYLHAQWIQPCDWDAKIKGQVPFLRK